MPIVLTLPLDNATSDMRLVPRILCDFCEQPITEVRDGVYLIPDRISDSTQATGAPLFAHHDRSRPDGKPLWRCHKALEEQRLKRGDRHGGWYELSDFLDALVKHLPGSAASVAQSVMRLQLRDAWLVRWLAAGQPQSPLLDQPKAWRFDPSDAEALAIRLEVMLPPGFGSAQDDDDQAWTP